MRASDGHHEFCHGAFWLLIHLGHASEDEQPDAAHLSDVAFFRSLAGVEARDGQRLIYILNPADAFSAYALTLAMAEHPGACYMRTMRPDVPFLYDSQTEFHLGGHHVLIKGSDLLLIATGYMVHEAKRATALLQQHGIQPTLIDLYSLPFDYDAIAALASENQGRILTVEDNYGASFGSAVADAMTANGAGFRMEQMFVRKLPKSGRIPDDLLGYLGLSADDIVETALHALGAYGTETSKLTTSVC